MKIKIEEMQPLLAKAQAECKVTMQKIEKDKKVADETEIIVTKETKKVAKDKAIAEKLAAEAEEEVRESNIVLNKALKQVEKLSVNDITEVKNFTKPNVGTKMIIKAVCILLGVKPDKKTVQGVKTIDYWTPAKTKLMTQPKQFLLRLLEFAKKEKKNIS